SCAAWSVLAFAGRAGAFDLWTIGGRRRLLAFSSSASDCINNSQGINCRLHIVNSHDVSPVHRRNDRARDCSVKTLVRGSAIKKLSDKRFSRGADYDRKVFEFTGDLIEISDQFKILFRGLAKADSGIDCNAL